MNPFEGMTRKRYPAMHMITALHGGVPLIDALAGHFFRMLHDRIEHNCLLKPIIEENERKENERINNCSDIESCTMGSIFNMMGMNELCGEEFSYLDNSDVYIFYMIADSTIEATQDWLGHGKEPIKTQSVVINSPDGSQRREVPLFSINELVKTHFNTFDHTEDVEYVRKISAEFQDFICLKDLMIGLGLAKTTPECLEAIQSFNSINSTIGFGKNWSDLIRIIRVTSEHPIELTKEIGVNCNIINTITVTLEQVKKMKKTIQRYVSELE